MEITYISNIDSTQNQNYTSKDESLLNSIPLSKDFGLPQDKIEVHVISLDGTTTDSTYDFRNYKIVDTTDNSSLYHTIELDPKSDLESFGYFRGQYDINYNFYREIFSSSLASQFFISEISSDRTEIKISTNNVSYTALGQSYLNYIAERNSRAFYSDFIVNFGDNKTYIGVNIAFDNVNTSLSSLYIKLYEPLPSTILLKDTLWLVEQISEPLSYRVNTEFIAEEISDSVPLRGPNVSVELNESINLTTPLLNLSTLLNTSVTSSYQQLQSWLEENSVEITVNYTDFSNFVHFSSATERLENFKYKLSQIESLQTDINNLDGLNGPVGFQALSNNYIKANKSQLQSKIDTIIEKFDGYEYFLYFESGSNNWPKTNSSKPYLNYHTTSSQAKSWFGSTIETSAYYGGQILDAFNYDNNNKDYIWNNLPEYIKEDSQNSNLELFVAMMGQHYDYIWTYVRDITDLQVADNRVNFGISKDLVADTLKNFGIKLYTNSRNQDDIFSSLLGVNSAGGFLPLTGSLKIDNYITASQYTIPDNDIVKETYKRIYHNLPYLLKSKGTRRGLYSLINCFGIPETILKIKEYGGNKKDQDIIEQFNEKFNYSLKLNNTASLAIPFQPSYKQYLDTGFDEVYPDTFEFRFKFDGTSSLTQSLLQSQDNKLSVGITPSTSSYASLFFKVSGSGTNFITSSQITLPFYNKDWWNLNITKQSNSLSLFPSSSLNELINNFQARVIADGGTFELTPSLLSTLNLLATPDLTQDQYYIITVGNKDSNGIQYLNSSSLFITGTLTSSNAVFNSPNTFYLGGTNNYPFSGSVQEFRYWVGSIPTNNFKDHILNPQSVVYNGVTGSYDNLIFRLPLGSELDNTKTSSLSSVHPALTSSFISASVTSSKAIINNYLSSSYKTNNETFLVNTPNIGSITEIDEKVRIADPNLIPGDVLTPYISIQKPETFPYTKDLSIVEVAISPQDSINEDIISQLGSFNIDEYIGDPRLASLNSYPSLTELRNFYFKKYSKSGSVFDIIKLLSYFDNSLFKMIKDFVPAKANLSTGLIIKPHILERNKISRHEPVLESKQYSGSIEMAFITGSNGLGEILNTDFTSFIPFTGDYRYKVADYYGDGGYKGAYKSYTDKRELFTGELGGTIITVHSQSKENIVYEFNTTPNSSSEGATNQYFRVPFNPLLNNAFSLVTSSKYLNIDYNANNIIPSNNNSLIKSLLSNINDSNYSYLNSPVQDINYTLYRHITPRYNGSKLTGTLYNIYTPGDKSYGKDPVINLHTVKFAYFKEITSQSRTLPGRSNVNVKYLIDSASNITELTEANRNIFDLQNTFNKNSANILLDNVNSPSLQKASNGVKPIYAGGFKYEPILQNWSNSTSKHAKLDFLYFDEVPQLNPNQIALQTGSISPPGQSLGFSIRNPRLSNSLTYTNPENLLASRQQISCTLDSGILFDLKRETFTDIEIKQRIQGSFKVSIKVSPPSNTDPVILYENDYLIGSSYYAYGLGNYSAWYDTGMTPNNTINDNIRSAYIPAGKTVFAWGYKNNSYARTYVGPTTVTSTFYGDKTPFYGGSRGFDGMTVYATNTTTNFQPSSLATNFTTTTATFNVGSGIKNLTGEDSLIVEVTYNFDGIVVLPKDISEITVKLKTLTEEIGNIKQTFNFNSTSAGNTAGSFCRFRIPPTIENLSPSPINNQYYYETPPKYVYVTSSVDRGIAYQIIGQNDFYISKLNWYFERGNSITTGTGSQLTLMTASSDLSKLWYDMKVDKYSPFYGNQIIQTLPSQSILASFVPITEYFNPKIGDLVRLYNTEVEDFPFSNTFEREIIRIIEPQTQNIGTGSRGTGSYENRLVFELSTVANSSDYSNIQAQSCENNPSGSQVGHILNFIFLSKIPDETNIILTFEKKPGQTSQGVIVPEDITPPLKKETGNIIRGLKSNNMFL